MPEVAKSRVWKISALIMLAGLVLLLIDFLCAPLPPPQVVLSDTLVPATGRTALANMVISNAGGSTVGWRQIDWELEAETPDGLVTNRPWYRTAGFYTMLPTFHDTFQVDLPSDALRWRVKATYRYYKHHNLRFEFSYWLREHPYLYQKAQSVPNIVSALLRLLPGSKEFEGSVYTPFITNQVPLPPNP